MGLKNMLVRCNPLLLRCASESPTCIQCVDFFHSGGGGVCRICRGETIKLDDCPCQQVNIGPLRFNATDYVDSLNLGDFLQRRLVSPEKEERNRRTLISAAAGPIASATRDTTLPARIRVAQTERELRHDE